LNELLKQRLIGALILLALGVVFWPIIFVEPETSASRELGAPPPFPGVATDELPAPDAVGLRQSPELAIDTAEPDLQPDVAIDEAAYSAGEYTTPASPERGMTPDDPAPRIPDEAPEKPALDEDGIPIAWTLQVATMSSKARAQSLRDDLIEAGYKAYIRPLARGDGSLHRVYIGPKFERARIEELKPDIDAAYSVESLVARYVP
jgi:DedD protein